MERQDNCSLCNGNIDWDWGKPYIEHCNGKTYLRVDVDDDCYCTEMEINFCPMCGRKLV